jgi:threonine dehydrogenase-like Zn-dependent dehydrogenase
MLAAALVGYKDIRIWEIDAPVPKASEVVVKVEVCGVCSSELNVWLDEKAIIDKPRFIGHEVSGTVLRTGDEVSQFVAGDRVVIYPYRSSGFADEVCVPEKFVMKLADHIPFDLALGEPIGCAMNAVRRSRVEIGDTVVVIGAGFMGALILQGVKWRGAGTLIAVDTRDEPLQTALQLGADIAINSSKQDVREAIAALTGGGGADVVIEATGYQAPLELAGEIVRTRGTIVIYGYHQGGPRTVDMKKWNFKGLDVINAHERDPDIYMQGIRAGMKLMEKGKLIMEPLVTHRFALDRIGEAFETSASKPPGFMKAIIVAR